MSYNKVLVMALVLCLKMYIRSVGHHAHVYYFSDTGGKLEVPSCGCGILAS